MTVELINLTCSDFLANVCSSFTQLKRSDTFADVTLVSDDNVQIQAHKLILSVGSEYFRNILSDKTHPHPMLCLDGVSSVDLEWIIRYLYIGEVSVPQSSLQKFLHVANKLKCYGLKEERHEETDVIKAEEKVVYDEVSISEDVQVTGEDEESLFTTFYEDAEVMGNTFKPGEEVQVTKRDDDQDAEMLSSSKAFMPEMKQTRESADWSLHQSFLTVEDFESSNEFKDLKYVSCCFNPDIKCL